MKIRPIGTVRGESTYKVSAGKAEATVVHSTKLRDDIVYCVDCADQDCVHADEVRRALRIANREKT